jgi:hypothetical protein
MFQDIKLVFNLDFVRTPMGSKFIEMTTKEDGLAVYVLTAFMAMGALAFYKNSQTTAERSYEMVRERLESPNRNRQWQMYEQLTDDDELCTKSNIFAGVQKSYAVETGKFDKKSHVKGGKKAVGTDILMTEVVDKSVEIDSYPPEYAAAGILDPIAVMQSDSPLSRTSASIPSRVPFKLIAKWMQDEIPTEEEVKAGLSDQQARTERGQKEGYVRSWWIDYQKDNKGRWRKVWAWTAADFMVELDSSNKPVACYSQVSSRNFCVSAGGVFNNNPAAGKPKCTQT